MSCLSVGIRKFSRLNIRLMLFRLLYLKLLMPRSLLKVLITKCLETSCLTHPNSCPS